MQYKTISCPHLFPSPKNLAGQIFRLAPNGKREVCKAAASGGFAAACASPAIKSKKRVSSVRALSENLAGQIFQCSSRQKKGRFETTGRGGVPGQCRTKIWPARFFSAAPVERKGVSRPREEVASLGNAARKSGRPDFRHSLETKNPPGRGG